MLKFNNFVDIVVEVSAAFEASHFLTLVINKLLELNGSSKAHDQALVGLIKRSTISVDAVVISPCVYESLNTACSLEIDHGHCV